MPTMTMPSARQPFASLSGSRLKNLTNIKNKQNALPTAMASSLKRHAPEEFDEVGSENIDPLMLSSPSKKGRSFEFDFAKSAKPTSFALTTARTPAQYVERAPAASQKRKVSDNTATPNNELKSNKRAQPSSAPAPAGRSPKSKKAGILSRRRMTAIPFTRISPPTFSTHDSDAGLPFSIDAALAGSVPAYKAKSKSKSTHRKNWQFEIHEDTPDDEMTNLMEHSTCTLDISDDESRAACKEDKDNKENIPPVDGPAAIRVSTQVTASRRDMMTDEARNPLGDLDATEFYAEGCDASSVYIVGIDDATDNAEDKCAALTNQPGPCSPAHQHANAVIDGRDTWKEVIGQLVPDEPAAVAGKELTYSNNDPKTEPAEIQIWESESAKGDEDDALQEHAVDGIDHQSLLVQ